MKYNQLLVIIFIFFFNDTATTEIYTLSLHDALPICLRGPRVERGGPRRASRARPCPAGPASRDAIAWQFHGRGDGAARSRAARAVSEPDGLARDDARTARAARAAARH